MTTQDEALIFEPLYTSETSCWCGGKIRLKDPTVTHDAEGKPLGCNIHVELSPTVDRFPCPYLAGQTFVQGTNTMPTCCLLGEVWREGDRQADARFPEMRNKTNQTT